MNEIDWDELKREDMEADIDEYEVCDLCRCRIKPWEESYYEINGDIFCKNCILEFRR